MSRFAREKNVYFFEEPVITENETFLDVRRRDGKLSTLVPHISRADADERGAAAVQKEMLQEFLGSEQPGRLLLWYYTPMAMDFSEGVAAAVTVYDCMDELSAFKFAPPELIDNEQKLLEKADLVFTGGHSLYESKRGMHPDVHAFPSSIDVEHFSKARELSESPADQAGLGSPLLGFCGVIDERFNIELLREMAEKRPEWQFAMVGPVVKISDEDLPKASNIHYLGGKDYADLPAYLSGWDIAMMPFAMNESTRFISPTKTPEYLAAGKPVISTPIRDVVRPYGEKGLVEIASTADEFIAAAEKILASGDRSRWLSEVDAFLSGISWDRTWDEMNARIRNKAGAASKVLTQAV